MGRPELFDDTLQTVVDRIHIQFDSVPQVGHSVRILVEAGVNHSNGVSSTESPDKS